MLSQQNPLEGLSVDDKQLAGITAAIHSFRRIWSLPEVRKIVLLLLHEGKAPADITSAGIRAASDKRVQAPQAILWDEFWVKPGDDKKPGQAHVRHADLDWQRQNRAIWAACKVCDEWGYVWSEDKIQMRCNHDATSEDGRTPQARQHAATARAQIKATKFREVIERTARGKSVDGERPWLPPDLEQQTALRRQQLATQSFEPEPMEEIQT